MALAVGSPDYYGLLGVAPDAPSEEIKQAFRRKLRATHPRLNPGGSPDEFQRVQRAYEVLANPAERVRYDAVLGIGTGATRRNLYHRSYRRLLDTLVTALPSAGKSADAAA